MDDLKVLRARVEDLQHILILDQQIEQRLQVQAGGLGVYRSRLFGRGDLDQAQVGPIGVLAHEFRVDGNEIDRRKAGTELFKGSGVDDQRVKVHCGAIRSEEHTYELQSLMRISYAVFCLKKKK